MATILLIDSNTLTQNTILGGNIDPSKYQSDIKTCQNLYIKNVLGNELYNKICNDYANNSLTGIYEEIYEEYVKNMVIHGTTEIYLAHGAYTISNAGISKLVAQQGATSVDKNEVDFLIQSSRRLYEMYKDNFLLFMRDVSIPEYKNKCVKKTRRIGGWII